MVMTADEKITQQRESRALLEGTWPDLFCYQAPRPLKVGIIDDMADDAHRRGLPFDRELLRTALGHYTRRYRYQAALKQGGKRYALDGQEAGYVTGEQKLWAATLLKRRDEKVEKQISEKGQASPE